MPSFAFWKSSKPDESKSPLLSDAAVKEELSVIIPNVSKAVELNPGNQDSGVFLFDEDAQEIPGDQTPVLGPAEKATEELDELHDEASPQDVQISQTRKESILLDVAVSSSCPQSPAIVPEEPTPTAADYVRSSSAANPDLTIGSEGKEEELQPVSIKQPVLNSASASEPRLEQTQESDIYASPHSQPVSLVPKVSGPTLSVEKTSTSRALDRVNTNLRDRDSGVYMSDNESSSPSSRPSSIVSNDLSPLRTRVSSLSKPTTASSQRTNSIARLQRPAELNLSFNSAPDAAKPKSELDMRYDLIRNSKTQSKAALRSPTQLLQDRLNMSPKKDIEEKIRIFTPPRDTVNGCLLPGPGTQAEAFTSTSVRAKTEAGGRPAWWCKFDKLVVFDGFERQADGEMRLRTRTSKGLTIARRRGDLETVVIPMDCAHCIEMLNRHEWKYDMRVCKRSVCWDCKERCKWEFEQERTASAATPRTDANRERADSMLQDEQSRSHNLAKEIVI